MSHQQPVIDGFEFASAGASKQGAWPLGDFPRLRDMLAADTGEVAYKLDGMRDGRGRPSLRVRVRGTLQLRCQRCLEAMPFEVQADALLVLAETLAREQPTDYALVGIRRLIRDAGFERIHILSLHPARVRVTGDVREIEVEWRALSDCVEAVAMVVP